MISNEVVLWMDKCTDTRLVANRVMLCIRNEFILMNERDFNPDEYHDIIRGSGSAGIIKE